MRKLFLLALMLWTWSFSDANAYKLPDTGQTTCYDVLGNDITCPIPGQPLAQDGSYNFLPLSYTNNGNGTITDNNTGLIWQKQDDGTLRTWDQAVAYCAGLNLGSLSGWRLPNRLELAGIVDYGLPSPGPVIHAVFTSAKSSYYWSATPSPLNPDSDAWEVYFDDGQVLLANKGLARYVRCVYGAETPGNITINPDDNTATDTTTGLIFAFVSVASTWEEAIAHCENLSLANQSDWRLPNIREMDSMISGLLATYFFSCDPPQTLISSTTNASSRGSAWGISCNALNGSSIYYYDKDIDNFGFICVREGYPGLYKLNVTKSGNGTGTVMSAPTGIDCPNPMTSCYTWFPANTPVTLTAIPNEGAIMPFVFAGWTPAADCSYGEVKMDTEKTCNATFSACGTWERARVPAATRNSINEAYFWAANGDVIQVKASNKTENVSFQLQTNVTLMGGYDCNFVRVKGAYSVITGLVTIKLGSVIFDMIIIM